MNDDLIDRLKKPFRPELMRNFDPNDFGEQIWNTARHEAAHFFAGILHGFTVSAIHLRLPQTKSTQSMQSGEVGVVHMEQIMVLDHGKVVGRFAGPAADYHIHGLSRLTEETYTREECMSGKKLVCQQMKDSYNTDLYLGGREPSQLEIKEACVKLFKEAQALVDKHWSFIEFVAKILITHCNKSDGRLRHNRLHALILLAKEYASET